MSEDLEKIGAIRERVKRLIELCDGLKERNRQLEEEKSNLQEALDKKEEECKELSRQVDALHSSRAMLGEDTSPASRERLDQMVREIDRCIGLMNG